MAKTGLFGFGYINENIFYGKLGDLLGRDVTVQDKQLIHNFVQQQLDKGCIEYYACDKQGNVARLASAPQCTKEILAKAVSIGMTDQEGQEILAYVCQQPGPKWSTVYVGARPTVLSILSAYHIGYLNFRNFKEADEFICGIHDVLLPGEQWGFAKSEENPSLIRRTTRYQILESYLRHTFAKLMLEYNKPDSDNYGKIVFSQDRRYCYFNTGLLTKYAQDLYLTGEVYGLKDTGIFTCNNPRFVDSKIELVKTYGFAQRDIDPGPGVASFFRTVSDIVYDPSITIDFTESKLEHIIDDGIRRNRFPRKYTVSQTGMPIPPWSLAQMLNNSIKIACMMAQRNYKYVIPQYRPAGVEYVNGKKVHYDGQIQFLMPIYLSADYFSPPDFALVLSRRDGFYVPETILLLPWAYNNARILCKPDNSWLNPNTINPEDLLVDEEEGEDESFEEETRGESAPLSCGSAQTIEDKALPVPVHKPDEKPVEKHAEKPSVPPTKKAPEKGAATTVQKSADSTAANPPAEPAAAKSASLPVFDVDSLVGKVMRMSLTGTTASKALKCESGAVQGTISLKRLAGHKALEFHGLSAQVRILTPNTCGGSYQCEFAEEIDGVLARKKVSDTERQTKPEEPKKPLKAAQSGWAWADPMTIFSQRPTVVESFRDLAVGQRYNATVRDIVPYGVFVDIGYADGNVLLHKSQFAPGAKPAPGDVITVWIHALDAAHKKIQVTMNRPEAQ